MLLGFSSPNMADLPSGLSLPVHSSAASLPLTATVQRLGSQRDKPWFCELFTINEISQKSLSRLPTGLISQNYVTCSLINQSLASGMKLL